MALRKKVVPKFLGLGSANNAIVEIKRLKGIEPLLTTLKTLSPFVIDSARDKQKQVV
jgi:hypothetical protein